MVRTRFRLLVAAGTLLALLGTGVSPVIARVMAGAPADSHACCPETIRASATEGHQTDVPMPCCAIGNTRQPVPAKGQTPTRGAESVVPVGPEEFRHPPVRAALTLLAFSSIPLGQIPPLLRTSVLLI